MYWKSMATISSEKRIYSFDSLSPSDFGIVIFHPIKPLSSETISLKMNLSFFNLSTIS